MAPGSGRSPGVGGRHSLSSWSDSPSACPITTPTSGRLSNLSNWKMSVSKNCPNHFILSRFAESTEPENPPQVEPPPRRRLLCVPASSAWGSTWASCRWWRCCVWTDEPLAGALSSPESREPRDSEAPAAGEPHAGPPDATGPHPGERGFCWWYFQFYTR